jgi:hypothetical protein
VSASTPLTSVMPRAPSISPCGNFGAGNCTWCLCELPVDGARSLDSTTLLGKNHGDVPDRLMVCSHACKHQFASGERRNRKKQQKIIKRLYFDVFQTNVRVGDTVQVVEDKSSGRRVEAFDWGVVKGIRFDRARGCAEISVKGLDTTVRVWPAGVRLVDAKENDGCALLRQRGGGGDILAERSRNTAQLERLAVKCDSQSKRAAGAEAAIAASTRMAAELLEAQAALRRETERASAEASAFIYIECTSERGMLRRAQNRGLRRRQAHTCRGEGQGFGGEYS